jgi:hypothetical protein
MPYVHLDRVVLISRAAEKENQHGSGQPFRREGKGTPGGRRMESRSRMPNAFAYLMLLVWPAVSVGLFRLMTVERALIWTILGGYLLLPPLANFNFPLIPALDKTSIPNVAAFLICALMLGKRIPLLPDSITGRLLMILFVVSPVATVLTNKEPIVFAVGGLPAMRLYDAVSAVINQAIFVLPFFLARRFLNTEAAQREILFAVVVAGLVYSLPMLVEMRLSPQITFGCMGSSLTMSSCR